MKLKARHIRRIRLKMKLYDVWVTVGLFGVDTYRPPTCSLLARSPKEAARRAYRKGLHTGDKFIGIESDSNFARYAVRLSNKKSQRFTTYWK